jgi:hypothetical protein
MPSTRSAKTLSGRQNSRLFPAPQRRSAHAQMVRNLFARKPRFFAHKLCCLKRITPTYALFFLSEVRANLIHRRAGA